MTADSVPPDSPVWEIPGARECKCRTCGIELDIGWICEPCFVVDERKRTRAEIIERMGILDGLPKWRWARVGDPLFVERVRVGRFRAFAEKWVPKLGNAVLLGPSGSGKTVAMRACADRLIRDALNAEDRRHPICCAHWLDAHGLLRALKEHRLGDGRPEALSRAMRAPILFLDEIGQEPQSEVLFELLNERYVQELPTVVTSGLPIEQIAKRYGDAFVRRLVERGTVVEEWPGA